MLVPTSPLACAPARLLEEATRPWAPPRGGRIVAAVSGGADSVALLRLLAGLAPGRGWEVVVATLDHGLRGAAGEADRAFVEDLARTLGLPVRSERIVTGPGRGPEDAARSTRRAFLERIAVESGAVAVAVAHTADDQAETVLFRLLRGTGARGLAGMRRWKPPWWRPLLGVRRADLRDVLADLDQAWREDETNLSPGAVRNRLRREALPALERALGTEAVPALARAAAWAADDEDFLTAEAASAASRVVVDSRPGTVVLNRRAVCDLPSAVSRRILRRTGETLAGEHALSSTHLVAIEALARGDSPGTWLDLPRGLTARREGSFLILATHDPARSDSL